MAPIIITLENIKNTSRAFKKKFYSRPSFSISKAVLIERLTIASNDNADAIYI